MDSNCDNGHDGVTTAADPERPKRCQGAARSRRRVHAAGVLPFAVGDDGDVMVLLGQERARRNFRYGGMWCDFGGSIKRGAIATTAAREFFEETMGVVYPRRETMRNRIDAGDVCAVMDAFVPGFKAYRTYLVQIPFAPYPQTFAQRACASWVDTQKAAPQLFRQIDGSLRREATEKTALRWVTLHDALRDLPLRPDFAVVVRNLMRNTAFLDAVRAGVPVHACALDEFVDARQQPPQSAFELPAKTTVEFHGRGCTCGVDSSVGAHQPNQLRVPTKRWRTNNRNKPRSAPSSPLVGEEREPLRVPWSTDDVRKTQARRTLRVESPGWNRPPAPDI